jgi:E3 ubiquitin-protein ligase HACE1
LAAQNGHDGCLRVLHELSAGATLSAENAVHDSPAHWAATNSHEGCLRVLHELGAGASLSAEGAYKYTPAHNAAKNGREGCLRVLHELGAGASLSANNAAKQTPAHLAAQHGCERCLRVLHELGAGASLAAEDEDNDTPALYAAKSGQEGCLRVLHELGAGASLSAEDANEQTPAHWAASNGHEGCLRVLHELGAGATLSAGNEGKRTPAHSAAKWGHGGCLRVLHELGAGASLFAEDLGKDTPAHRAANHGQEGCLRVLHELGAGASLSAENAHKRTPAHYAAQHGHEGCLRLLHECLSPTIDPVLKSLSQFRSTTISAAINELKAMVTLATHSDDADQTPAHEAAAAGHVGCVRFLSEIGGTAALLRDVRGNPELLEDKYRCLLLEQGLLDLPAKQAWLSWSLARQVGGAGAERLELVCRRDDMLDGLCVMLGVDGATGELLPGEDAPQPSAINVHFAGENGIGAGLRREWFDGIVSEMLDPSRGLFISKDGGRSLVPNPHSATTAGADHLSYFALLGRIAGLALFHCVPLNASWSRSFITAVFEFELRLLT